jgi:hypothetical protein
MEAATPTPVPDQFGYAADGGDRISYQVVADFRYFAVGVFRHWQCCQMRPSGLRGDDAVPETTRPHA